MKKKFSGGSVIRSLDVIFTAILGVTSNAQNPSLRVFEDWNSQAGTQNMFQRSVVRTEPGTTNYFLAGATLNAGGNYDLLVTKYNAGGAVIWSQQVNGNGNGDDYAADLQIDNSGNVIVTGTTFESSADSFNVLTVMYDSGGNQQWIASYNGSGSGNDGATSIYVDNANGDIYVAGAEWQGSSTLYDVLLIKYDSGGNQQWTATYDNTNLVDVAVRVRQNIGTGNIEVGGATQTTLTNRKYLVAEFDPSSGSLVNAYTSTSSTLGIENLTDLKTDNNGNVFVTGSITGTSTGMDIRTLMLDTNLSIVWSATYSGAFNDEGNALDLDAAGNILVTGYTTSSTQGRNFITIKYNSAGSQLWATTFNGGANGDDSATCIAVHPTDTNKIYVCGYSYNGSNKDYQTLKYDGAGNLKWEIGFNNIYNTDDRAFAIALDTVGNVIVAGQNKLNDSTYEYTTVKYVEKSTLMPDDTISATSTSFVFTENRGQLFGTDSLQHPEVKFYTIVGQPRVYFMDTAVSYVFAKLDSATTNDSLARIDMKFKNANSDLRIRSLDQLEEVNNFYNSRIPGHEREQVHNYDQLISFNVWNNVDMVYGSNMRGLKYYFICKPGGGGNPATQIDLLYQGVDSVRINGSGQLVIYSGLGNIVHPKASAWQLDASGNFSSLGWQPSYTLLGTNEVGFTGFGSYNTAYPLIIAVDWGDIFPTVIQNLDWSTYYGGNAMDQLNDVDVNQANGSSHYSGWTLSPDFPTTLFPFQASNSGGWDAVAVRCKSNGQRVYSTYYGTSGSSGTGQWAETGAVDSNGNFFIGGRTAYSVHNIIFPIQPPGSYMDTTFNGAPQDGFIAAFDTLGQLFWATYYGGSGSSTFEGIFDMLFDANGNLYALMICDSLTPCFYQAGAYNDTSSNRNGMILKFDQNLALKWATRFGTDSGGTVSRIAKDALGNLYATGTAENSLLPIINPGGGAYVDSTFGGAADAFLARFNSADSLTWSTYFGGDVGGEVGNGIEIISGEIYLYGSTYSTDFPYVYAGSGTYIDSSYNAGKDIFIAEFKANGQLIWSTFIGGTGSDTPGNIDADTLGNIYCTGTTTSSNFPLVNTAGIYYDGSNAGGTDAVLFSFNVQKQMTWATYFGGTNTEGLNEGIDVYADSLLYICGWTSTPNSAASPFPFQVLVTGYSQGTLTGIQSDGFISRFVITPLIILKTEEYQGASSINGDLAVYPNPSSGEFQVIVDLPNENSKIEVYDMMGQLVSSVPLPDSDVSQTVSLNLSEQATGIYFIVLRDGTGAACSQKVIKQ